MFRADNTTDSIEGSVDMVVDELQNQITHVKGKTETSEEGSERSQEENGRGGIMCSLRPINFAKI